MAPQKRHRDEDGEERPAKSQSPAPRAHPGSPLATPSRKRARLTISEFREWRPVSHASINTVPGEMFVFGDGDCGQLGLGEDVTERQRPYPLAIEGKKVLQVSAGGMHSVVLLEDHSVWSWGVNDEGALGRYTAGKLWEQSGEAKGEPSDAYRPGKVELPENLKVVQISAGDSHTAFLTDHGAVYIAGTFRDSSGVMGLTPEKRIALRPEQIFEMPRTSRDRVCRIVSGADHVLALTEHGHVYSWGCGQQGQLGRLGERIPERSKLQAQLVPAEVTAVKRSKDHTAADDRVVEVACGTYSSFFILADGRVAVCGLNNYGQLGVSESDNMLQIPTLAASLTDIAAVAGGQHHTLALTKQGKVLSFGRPTYGRLGQKDADVGADAACADPKPVDGLEECQPSVAGVAAGLAVSGCFGAGEGRCFVWGFGSNNQLGNGDDDADFALPERIKETKNFNLKKVVQLEFGGQHTILMAVPREVPAAAAADGAGAQ